MPVKNEHAGGWLQKAAQSDNVRRWILILGLAGIALIFLSGFFGQKENTESTEIPDAYSSEQYAQQLEENLLEIVRAITGEEDAQVMVTLESGARQVYATEEKRSAGNSEEQSNESTVRTQSNDDTETNYIIVKDSDGSQRALAVTEISPEIRGVVVVCGSSGDAELQQQIIDAVTTALQISSARVCVVSHG